MKCRLVLAATLAVLALPLLASGAAAATFSNATPIVVPRPGPPAGCPTTCPSENATPYPSTIAVIGLSGTVTDVNVTLRNVTYEFNGLADADVLLVAPGGRAVMIMSDVCGNDSNPYPVASAITLTFDDQAPAPIPANAACAAGTYRPLDDDGDGEFPFHVADGFTDGPTAPATTLPLSTFNGIDPNGQWSLYVVDDYPNDPDPSGRAGQIGGGWSIDLVTSAGAEPMATTAATTTTKALTTATTAAPTSAPVRNPTAPTVAPATATTQASSDPALARTGSNNGPLVAIAGTLIAIGVATVRLSRPKNRAMYIEVRWR
jgi:subtilisin-like proprotein convertase family protein